MKNKILICAPELNELGGVANHYKGLAPYLTENADFHVIGRRKGRSGSIYFFFDLIAYAIKIFRNYDVILLNPSLQKRALLRDYLYLALGKFLNRKVIIFIHGWDAQLENEISNSSEHFFLRYKKADEFIVLCSDFMAKLQNWGFENPIHLTTTKVSDDFFLHSSNEDNKRLNKSLLFMSRITKEKGIFVAIDAYERLLKSDDRFSLTVIGDGPELNSAIAHAKKKNLKNIKFLGKLSGSDLINAMDRCECYLFPSWHGEGMPTSVLEALSLGMIIVSTRNAGIIDFFEEKNMGVYCAMGSVDSLVEGIKNAYSMDSHKVSIHNKKYALNNFSAKKVADSLLGILKK